MQKPRSGPYIYIYIYNTHTPNITQIKLFNLDGLEIVLSWQYIVVQWKQNFMNSKAKVKILLFAWPIKYSTTKQITNETQKPKERESFYAIYASKKLETNNMFKVNRPTHCCFISAYLMPNKLKNLRPTSFQILESPKHRVNHWSVRHCHWISMNANLIEPRTER